jgi:hypothetical protein
MDSLWIQMFYFLFYSLSLSISVILDLFLQNHNNLNLFSNSNLFTWDFQILFSLSFLNQSIVKWMKCSQTGAKVFAHSDEFVCFESHNSFIQRQVNVQRFRTLRKCFI